MGNRLCPPPLKAEASGVSSNGWRRLLCPRGLRPSSPTTMRRASCSGSSPPVSIPRTWTPTPSSTIRSFPSSLARLDRFYRNPKIFHPRVKEGCVDSVHSLADGHSAMAFGNSSWMPIFRQLGFHGWGVADEPRGEGIDGKTCAVLCAVSALTCRPEESLAFLRHLGSLDTQRSFALKGQPVARRDACAEFKFEGLELALASRFVSMLERGRVPRIRSEDALEIHHTRGVS